MGVVSAGNFSSGRVGMKVSFLFAGAFLGVIALINFWGATAQAQVIVTLGSGHAHDCFVHAKTGEQPRQGLAVCNTSLAYDTLDRKNRAGTYDNRGVVLNML